MSRLRHATIGQANITGCVEGADGHTMAEDQVHRMEDGAADTKGQAEGGSAAHTAWQTRSRWAVPKELPSRVRCTLTNFENWQTVSWPGARGARLSTSKHVMRMSDWQMSRGFSPPGASVEDSRVCWVDMS